MAFDVSYYNDLALCYRERRLLRAERQLRLAADVGVATVPGSSFSHERSLGHGLVRFAFCKRKETLEAAAERLVGFAARV